MYNCTSYDSFEKLEDWKKFIQNSIDPNDVSINLCCNEIQNDGERIISQEKGQNYAKNNKFGYHEISENDSQSIEKML